MKAGFPKKKPISSKAASREKIINKKINHSKTKANNFEICV
jgi:hypothetical protein